VSAEQPAITSCSFLRRLGAMFYDMLLLGSVFFFSTLIMLPFNQGMAIVHNNIPYDLFLLIISYCYFTWQWTHGGQTPGMRAWNIKLRAPDAGNVTWQRAGLRYLLALLAIVPLGAGFLWALFDRDKLAFHDRYSNTMLVIIAN
jgi:uncharacterized RDD family membrane protein YckC